MSRKIMIPRTEDQVRAMCMLLEAHEASTERDFEAVYQTLLALLRSLTITEEARQEARRLHSEFLAKRNADREASGKSASEARIERIIEQRSTGYGIPAEMPDPETTPEEPIYQLPTRKMEKAVEKFDALPDEAQVNHLAGLWGES